MKKSIYLFICLFLASTQVQGQKTTRTVLTWGNFFGFFFNGGQLNWSNNNSWDNGVPADGDTVVIQVPTRYNVNQVRSLGRLVVNDPLSINNNRTLRTKFLVLNDDININGFFTLYADQVGEGRILSVSNNGAINGTFTSEYYIDRCNNWSVYGAPFDVTFNDLASLSNGNMVYTGFPDSDYPTFNYVNAYLVDENWTNGYDGYLVPTSANQTIPRGEGFWYWNSDTSYNSTNPNNSFQQQWKVASSGSVDFSQTFGFNVGFTNNGSPDYDGWNLLSNPYPGTINWDATGWNLSGLTGEIHYFNTCSQNYSSYVGGVGVNGGSPLVSPYQGFYVKAISPSPTLTCDRRVIDDQYVDLRSHISNVLKIAFEDDEIAIRLHSSADENFNVSLDAAKFFNNSKLFSKSDTSNQQSYSINALKDKDTVIVPIYLLSGDTLWFSEYESFNDYNIYVDDFTPIEHDDNENLTDRHSNLIEINSTQDYFVVNSTSPNFEHKIDVWFIKQNEVVFSSVLDLPKEEFKIFTYDDYLVLDLLQPVQKLTDVEVYDMKGKIIEKIQLSPGEQSCRISRPHAIKLIRLNNGISSHTIKTF